MKDSILKVRRVLSVILPDNSTEFGDDAESIKKFSFDLQRFKDFYNEKNNKVITGTADNDSIRNWGSSNVTISGGDGNDSVYSSGDRVTISGGAGDDSIYSFGDKVTINGGTGDDTISSWNFDSVGTVYEYNSGDGNDVIMGLTSKDTLLINGTRKEIARKNDGDIIVGVGNNSITIKNYNLVNYKSNTAIIGTSYFDEIGNSGNNVTISGCDGNDSICNNAGSKVIINGGGGNDSIVNYGDNGTIKGDTGNDYIFNEGDYASISGGEGNDSIYNMYAAQDVMISGGDGNDYISNDWWSNWDVTINGGAGDDTIISHGYNVTINGGTGNDKISLSSSDYSSLRVIEYVKGDGNDLVQGFQASDTLIISGTKYSTVKSGNDVIVTAGSGKITLQGAASLSSINIKGTLGGGSDTGSGGKDTTPSGKNISNLKASTLVTGTAYNDTIKNSSAQVTIQGGDGKDKISLTSGATKNVIIGGTGNDSIYSSVTSGVLYKYAKGDGNDYIKGWTAKDTLTITGGAYKTSTTSSNVIVSVEGGEKITLAGAKGKTININPANLNVVGTSSADKINNSLSSATINALAGNDTIINSGANVYIDAGTGVDKITLKSSAKKNTVYGGAGNDTIYSSVTSGVMYLYNNGDGNDVIKSWTANDTISISGAEYTTLKSGSNIIVGVDSGQITLMGASGKNLNIKGILHQDNKGTSGADKVNNSLSGETINALAGNDTIINSGANVYIDAGTGADKITLKSSAKKNTVYGGAGNDTIYSSVTSGVMYLYNNGDGNDVIKSWTANDTISISGAEYTTLTSGSNVIVGVDSGKITLVGASGKTLNIKGILHQDNKGTSDADKINNSLSGETINALAGNDTIINSGANVYIDAGTGADKITLKSSAKKNTVYGGAGNDTIYSSVTSGVRYNYAKGDGNDVIKSWTANDTISISGAEYTTLTSGSNIIVGVDSSKITLVGASGKTLNIKGILHQDEEDSDKNKLIIGTAVANNLSNTTIDEATISGLGGSDTITNYGHSVSISGGAGHDTISNSGTDVTIRGDAGNDTIVTNGNGTLIDGGTDDDVIKLSDNVSNATIMGGTGNDEIHLNDNPQLIKYKTGDGKDTIFGFGDKDSVKVTITSGKISGPMQSGSNVVFDISGTNNAITFRNASSEDFKIENNLITFAKREITTITCSSKADSTLNSRSSAVINALSGNDTIKNTGDHVTILGGDGDDKISLGGSAADNVLVGGKGNDVIYSNGEGNCIKYAAGDGNDSIYSFSGTDYIEITNGKIFSVAADLSDKKFYINDKDHFITIKDGASKNFNASIGGNSISLNQENDFSAMLDETSEINYLLADNNFETSEFQIDSITEISDTNYSAGKITDSASYGNLTNDTLVAAYIYNKDK